jgi:hypothetical protein
MSLVPLGSLAKRFGVKAVCYGPAGGGKTPVLCTAPRPVILVTEPGMLSVREVMNVPAWDAINNPKQIVDFFKWLNSSAEAKGFDTVGMDSLSQMAELILREELGRNKDGRKAYGEMSRRVMEHMENLFYMPQKHTFLIAKQQIIEVGEGKFKQPYFPGQDLGVKIPHLFDEFWQLDTHRVPGQAQPVKALLTRQRFDTMARDRSGNLDEYEQPDLTNVFKKAMQ